MLIDLMSRKTIVRVPYESEFRAFMSWMTVDEIAAIKSELNGMIEGTEIQTAGWMPGSNWGGTVYQPIYEKAARRDYSSSARCFGALAHLGKGLSPPNFSTKMPATAVHPSPPRRHLRGDLASGHPQHRASPT